MSILKKLKITTTLTTRINQKYLRYFEHSSTRTNGLEKLILKGKINAKRPRKRPLTPWVDQIKDIIDHGLQEASFAAQNGEG